MVTFDCTAKWFSLSLAPEFVFPERRSEGVTYSWVLDVQEHCIVGREVGKLRLKPERALISGAYAAASARTWAISPSRKASGPSTTRRTPSGVVPVSLLHFRARGCAAPRRAPATAHAIPMTQEEPRLALAGTMI